MKITCNSITFSDKDVVEVDDYIPFGEFNPHNVRPFLIHDQGTTLAVVFATCLQDALDIAVDNDKLDTYLLGEDDLGEDSETATYLGNACEAFDIDTISAIELPNPRFSFAALLAADQQLPLEQDADDVHENP